MMRTLRPRSLPLLLCLLATSAFLATSLPYAKAQSSELATARQDLAEAFQSIQTAEQQGASNTDLLPLTAQLNTALQFEEAADTFSQRGNATLSVQYAVQSINLSTQVSLQAQRLGNTAQTSSLYRTTLSYILAVVLALLSAVSILEISRIPGLLKRRREMKAKIDYGVGQHAG